MRQLFNQAATLTRRDLLHGAAGLGALAALVKRGEASISMQGAPLRRTASSMILINLQGAPSHLDTFDVKDAPWYPANFDARPGSDGVVMSRLLLPGLLENSKELCIIKSVQSWEAEHSRGQFYLQTGHPSNPAFNVETPHFGAIVGVEKGGEGGMPPFLALNGSPNEGSKFLGGKYEPMVAPANQTGLATLEHPFFGANSRQRFNERFQFLEDLDATLRRSPFDPAMAAHADFYEAARKLMYDDAILQIFKFSADDNSRYGNSNFGRACVVARNAVRARNGVRFISINNGNWDTHQRMYDAAYGGNMYELCGVLDKGVTGLIEDLRSSGDLASTLICLMGEFGRTPGGLNAAGGRDHHRYSMSVVLAGGGVKGGKVIGATDASGDRIDRPGWSQDRPIVSEDLLATFYSALGIDWTKSIAETRSGRKFEYVPQAAGKGYLPVEEVFS
jgi:uncharacterized protein (DUF1501 family)